MHVRLPFIALFVGAITLPHPASAQTPADAPPPVFRSGVDLVRLDVRFLDASGRPVPDIRPDEVRVTEDGEARPVILFQRIAENGGTYAEAAERTIAGVVSTNQGAPRGQLYVLVFDQEHITAGAETRVRQAAETFLRERLRPQDRVAIYGLPAPGPALGFTNDLRAAVGALVHVRGDLQRTLTPGPVDMTVHEAYEVLRGNEAVISRFLRMSDGTLDRTGVIPDVPVGRVSPGAGTMRQLVRDTAQQVVAMADGSARRFLGYLTDVLGTFRGIDGRKTVVLFSEGFHGDHVSRELTEVARTAAETYSVVYAFDLNRRLSVTGALPAGGDTGAEIASRLEPLGGLAAETSGRLLLDASTHLLEALDALGDAEVDYYLVGFAPPAGAIANRDAYRHVRVEVTRPGVRVSMRTGYAVGDAPTPADRRRAIDTALAAPFSQQGLRLAYTTYEARGDRAGVESIAVSLETELPLAREPGDAADVVFAVRNAMTGQVVQSGSGRLSLPDRATDGRATGLGTWQVRFDLPAGTYLMRCVVREPGGLVGSADRRFVVRALDAPRVAASDLVLGRPGPSLPVRAVGYTAGSLQGAIRVYAREPALLDGMDATLEIVDPAGAAAGAPSRRLTVAARLGDVQPSGSGAAARDVTFVVPLEGLAAGDYVAHAVVQAAGAIVADVRRPVEVRVGAPPEPEPAAVTGPATGNAAAARPVPTVAGLEPRDALDGLVTKRLVAALSRVADAAVRRAAGEAAAGRWQAAADLLGARPETDRSAARLRALGAMDARDYAAAAASLTSVYDAETPPDADVAFLLGWCRVGTGDEVGAVSAFRGAAMLDPTLLPAHLALADAYVRLGRPALAIQALEAGLAALPDSGEIKARLDALKGR
ncbi:MAG: VWA domain-containing protein [Vicinamibacterales bacterium]